MGLVVIVAGGALAELQKLDWPRAAVGVAGVAQPRGGSLAIRSSGSKSPRLTDF